MVGGEESISTGMGKKSELILTFIQTLVRVIGVVYNQRSPQTITVLGTEVGVVPESTRMVPSPELISERVTWGNRALADRLRPIRVSRPLLQNTMPVLMGGINI